VRRNLLVHLIDVLLLHTGRACCILALSGDFGFLRILFSQLILSHSDRLILTITELWKRTLAEILLCPPKGQGDSAMSELEQTIHLVHLALGNRVKPVVAHFTREDHQ